MPEKDRQAFCRGPEHHPFSALIVVVRRWQSSVVDISRTVLVFSSAFAARQLDKRSCLTAEVQRHCEHLHSSSRTCTGELSFQSFNRNVH